MTSPLSPNQMKNIYNTMNKFSENTEGMGSLSCYQVVTGEKINISKDQRSFD
jgi:hypothetical protein